MSDLYREALLERLANPVGQGILENPDLEARLVNPLCGDEVVLQMRIKDGVIGQAVYSGNGCAISQISASFITEDIQGKKLEEIRKISKNDILNWLGINPSPTRLKCATLSLEVLQEALNDQI